MTTKRNRTPLEQLARERKHARVFFWTWCGIATALSIVANYLHLYADPITVDGTAAAAHTVELTKVQRGLVGITAPLMLMMSLHGLWLMLKNTSTRGVPEAEVERPAKLWWLGATGIGVVAVVAFYVSYTGLIVLARSAGMDEGQSSFYPLILDVPILVSLLALLIVRPIRVTSRTAQSATDQKKQRASAIVTVPVQRAAEPPKRESVQVQPAPRDPEPRVTTQETQPVAQETVNREPRHDSLKLAPSMNREPRREPSSAHHDTAQRLVESRATTQDVDTVAQILRLSDKGMSTREVASIADSSQSTVRRILAAARDLDTDEERELELVG